MQSCGVEINVGFSAEFWRRGYCMIECKVVEQRLCQGLVQCMVQASSAEVWCRDFTFSAKFWCKDCCRV